MRARYVDYNGRYFVCVSVAVFLMVSFGSVMTVVDISNLVRRPSDELTTMAFYWGYLLLPAVLLWAMHSAGMLEKSRFAFSLIALTLLCACFVWSAAHERNAWAWVAYWPACVACLLLAMLAHWVRRRTNKI